MAGLSGAVSEERPVAVGWGVVGGCRVSMGVELPAKEHRVGD